MAEAQFHPALPHGGGSLRGWGGAEEEMGMEWDKQKQEAHRESEFPAT